MPKILVLANFYRSISIVLYIIRLELAVLSHNIIIDNYNYRADCWGLGNFAYKRYLFLSDKQQNSAAVNPSVASCLINSRIEQTFM